MVRAITFSGIWKFLLELIDLFQQNFLLNLFALRTKHKLLQLQNFHSQLARYSKSHNSKWDSSCMQNMRTEKRWNVILQTCQVLLLKCHFERGSWSGFCSLFSAPAAPSTWVNSVVCHCQPINYQYVSNDSNLTLWKGALEKHPLLSRQPWVSLNHNSPTKRKEAMGEHSQN